MSFSNWVMFKLFVTLPFTISHIPHPPNHSTRFPPNHITRFGDPNCAQRYQQHQQ